LAPSRVTVAGAPQGRTASPPGRNPLLESPRRCPRWLRFGRLRTGVRSRRAQRPADHRAAADRHKTRPRRALGNSSTV